MEKKQYKIIFSVMYIVILLLLTVSIVFYRKYINVRNNPQRYVQDTVSELVGQVGKLIVLPQDEVPTVATVVDLEKLKDQPFFAKAKIGDKVLIYNNAKKVYLYNPESNMVVEAAPLNIGGEIGQESAGMSN